MTQPNASLHRRLEGHGYDSEDGRINAMNIFIQGGLSEFLETQPAFCPEFHRMIHDILHGYNSAIKCGNTKNGWGNDYSEQWQSILNKLSTSTQIDNPDED